MYKMQSLSGKSRSPDKSEIDESGQYKTDGSDQSGEFDRTGEYERYQSIRYEEYKTNAKEGITV